MLAKNLVNDLLYRVKINSIQFMQIKAENLLNPYRYHLSNEAKKRLRWLYVLYYECEDNVTTAANKIGISRQWLSGIKNIFKRNNCDPRSIEPGSRAPYNTANRKRVSQETEDKILEIRDKYPWGEKKISKVLFRDYSLRASPPTVNRYLHKHHRINPKISQRNKIAWQRKIQRENKNQIQTKLRYRPPIKIKDFTPGALVEKDMKLVPKRCIVMPKNGKYHLKDYFYFQHTFCDSFTRIRAIEFSQIPSSRKAQIAWIKAKKRLPFKVACMHTDNGGENQKDFACFLEKDDIIHFYSRCASPTDNPRVERSHRTDEEEFYKQGNVCDDFKEQKAKSRKWEHVYNWVRPHQALGYLTPMEFYKLWRVNPTHAYKIVEKYQAYLKKQRIRLAKSRRMKKKEQIENLMKHIEAKLGYPIPQKQDLKVVNLNQLSVNYVHEA